MTTKRDRVAAHNEELPSVNSYGFFITWYSKFTWKTKYDISLLKAMAIKLVKVVTYYDFWEP